MAEQEVEVGKVVHYYTKIGAAVIEVTNGSISVGDEIHIKGHTTNLRQKVNSIQVERENIDTAEVGQSVGIKVDEHVRQHDKVYKIIQ